MRPRVPPGSTVARLWDAQRGRCFWCGEFMQCGQQSRDARRWSREHLFPRSLYGDGIGRGAGGRVMRARICRSTIGTALYRGVQHGCCAFCVVLAEALRERAA